MKQYADNTPSLLSKTALRRMGLALLVSIPLMLFCLWLFAAQPSSSANTPSKLTSDATRLRSHVVMLSDTLFPRNSGELTNLNRCADYVAGEFRVAGATVEFQTFTVDEKQYRNVIGRFGGTNEAALIVGAHYDSCGMTPGADDNASGVAALIELACLIGTNRLTKPVELVAYTLEEPPYFKTPYMGSAIHAKSLVAQGRQVRGVIVLEMVGYFSDAPGSQSYPAPLGLYYPGQGNFIAIVGCAGQGDFIKSAKSSMNGSTPLKVCSVRGIAGMPGIDLSDHLNYWNCGFKAIVITDTAFFRNRTYHRSTDTVAQLDYTRLGYVTVAVYEALKAMDAQ